MKRLLSVMALALGLAGPAHAGFVITDIDPTDPDPVLPVFNDFAGVLTGNGFDLFFKNVGVSLTEAVRIDFYALASESGFVNRFAFSGGEFTEHSDINPANPFPGMHIGFADYGPGAISDWSFNIVSGGQTPIGCAMDGTCGLNTQAFAVFVVDLAGWMAADLAVDGLPSMFAAGGDTIVLGFDDDGAGPDDNHDDLMIVARIRNVIPEPATWALMILGFGGLGVMTRRRQALGA